MKLVAAFFIPVIIMLSIFVINGIFPFGERSFLASDMYHQYMPFFSEFYNKIRQGEGLSFSWNVGIGSNFLALYVYYLASPLHWIIFLFSEQYLIEAMSYLVVFKIGLAGLTSAFYFKKHFDTNSKLIVFASVFYALSGYMAAYNWNIMWLDSVYLLPLIFLGLEKLVKEGKPLLYCVTLALAIFTNYYIAIMICIFLVLYFLLLIFTEECGTKVVGDFVLYSLLAGGMAAVLLIPEVFAILETDFGNMDFPQTLKVYFPILDELARHSIGVTTEKGLEHWPNIYCGAAVFILIPLYAMNEEIAVRKRFAYLALIGFFLLSFSINFLDFIWHGLNYPDSLPARQSFIYILLILTMCLEVMLHIQKVDKKQLISSFIGAVIFLLGCEKFIVNEDFTEGIELLTLLFVTIYAVLIYYYMTRKSLVWKQILLLLTSIIVIGEVSINTYSTSVGTTSRTQYLERQTDYETLLEKIQEDSEFYRIEKLTRKTKNDGTLTGYPTASVFSSTLNSYVSDFYKRVGMRYSKVFYCFDGATPLLSAMLNVKYLFVEDSTEVIGDLDVEYTKVDQSGEIGLYESNYKLPFGYTVPEEFDLPEGYAGEPLKLQNEMVYSLGVKDNLFDRTQVGNSEEKVVISISEPGYYYMVVSASGTKKIEATGDFGTFQFNDLKDGSVLNLGYLEENQVITFQNAEEDDETLDIKLDTYKMNEKVLEESIALLSADHLTDVTFDSTHISGKIELEQTKKIILSVPYEHGWNILVDGKEYQSEKFGDVFMTIILEEGTHSIEMTYIPYGKYLGILVSAVSFGIFSIIIFIKIIKRENTKKAC